jgi:predicted nucleic acid-binding Zn ribbon protein
MPPTIKRTRALGPRKPNARQRILTQWRGVDYAPLEKARTYAAKTAGTALDRVLKDLRVDTRRAEAEIVKVWNELLDPLICAHAQPTGLHQGTLFVTVDSSAWLSEIVRFRRKEILTRLQYSFGPKMIAKISFRVG